MVVIVDVRLCKHYVPIYQRAALTTSKWNVLIGKRWTAIQVVDNIEVNEFC